MNRHSVTDALSTVPNQPCSIRVAVAVNGGRVPALGRVLELFGGREAQDVGPLLERFLVVCVAQRGICGAVPAIIFALVLMVESIFIHIHRIYGEEREREKKNLHQHPRPRPVIAREIPPRLITPLLRRLARLPVRTRIVPARRILRGRRALHIEAAIGDAAVATRGLEDIRVGAGEHLGGHCAGAGARDEDARGVAAQLVDGVLDHVGDGLRVAAAVVCQGGRRRYVEAATAGFGVGVDEQEALG